MAVSLQKNYLSPGVFLESVTSGPGMVLETGVPVFIGLFPRGELDALDQTPGLTDIKGRGIYRIGCLKGDVCDGPIPRFTSFAAVTEAYENLFALGFLFTSVRGFFENGGKACRICALGFDTSRVTASAALTQALSDMAALTDIDLVSAPDIMGLFQENGLVSVEDVLDMQNRILDHCRTVAGRFAVLDTFPSADTQAAVVQRKKLVGDSGALYYPWLQTLTPSGRSSFMVPPSGHVCGIIARCDGQSGVHKAPANLEIEGVTDVESLIGNEQQDVLNPEHVNCIRSFPGRGIRIWGARTISRYPEWMYINVRRLFLTLSRWLDMYMDTIVFEPNDASLWGRVHREIYAYLEALHMKGALKGATAKDAFFVRCDSSTNTTEVRDLGQLVTEIGLAPTVPCEFIVIRITHSDSGTRIQDVSEQGLGMAGPSPLTDHAVISDVVIAHIEYTALGRDVDSEYVVIENRSGLPADLGNWTLRDRAGHVFRFPQYTLSPGSRCRVRTGRGTDTATDLYWNQGTAVWNNEGDQAVLRNRRGLTVHVYEYVA